MVFFVQTVLLGCISGQIILPHYTKVLSGKPRTVLASAAYGVLTGRRWAVIVCLICYIPQFFQGYLILKVHVCFQNSIYNWSWSPNISMDDNSLQTVLAPLLRVDSEMLQIMTNDFFKFLNLTCNSSTILCPLAMLKTYQVIHLIQFWRNVGCV